jgi:hypothetical protein
MTGSEWAENGVARFAHAKRRVEAAGSEDR